MGSSQSQPSQSAQYPPRPRLQPAPSSRSTTSSTPVSSLDGARPSRFSSFRRLSTLGRRDPSKRHRASSGTVDQPDLAGGGERKKQRVTNALSPPIEVPSSPSPVSETPLPVPSPSLPDVPVPHPQPEADAQPPSATPPLQAENPPTEPPGSPDALLPDRLRTLSTIRDTLGPDWSHTAHNASTARERLRNVQRRSISSAPSQENSETGRITDRIYNLLGLTPPGQSRSLAASPLPSPALNTVSSDHASPSVEEDSDVALEDLTRRLESARASLADARRQLEDIEGQGSGTEREAANTTGEAGNNHPLLAPTGARGIPAGAVLIIQGLAQTQAIQPADDSSSSSPDTTGPLSAMARHLPGLRGRSSSEGNVRSPSSRGTPTSHPGAGMPHSEGTGAEATSNAGISDEEPSVQGQARMISGLLTVAATATATTLLAPASAVSNTRTNTNPISSFLDRFRPHRRTASTVEAALGNYLRNALRSQSSSPASPTDSSPPILSRRNSGAPNGPASDGDIPDEFQRFLEGLQEDILAAVGRFTTPPEFETRVSAEQAYTNAQTLNSEVDAMGSPSPNADPSGRPIASTAGNLTADPASGLTADSDTAPVSVPSFHLQRGQNRPDDPDRRLGLSGGIDGQPRRLNFFRAHMFPPIQPANPNAEVTSQDDPEGMVPCIFVGVRSLAHDPAMTTDDLVAHPNFPFSDGNVPPSPSPGSPVLQAGANAVSSPLEDELVNNPLTPVSSAPGSTARPLPQRSSTDRPATPHPSSPSLGTDRRSLRERFLDRLVPRRAETTRSLTSTILNTYLVFVIGGYYPRSHPVLSIPNLITGGPLTDEEMSLISELMGPSKPPTASKEDIEKSGLEVVRGADIQKLGEAGKILENCLDRCLVCLGDYEPEEECRVLKCRHGFHRECVDHWLSSGRNSCPACRTEAVDIKKSGAAEEVVSEGVVPAADAETATTPAVPQARAAEDERLLDELD